jgi:pimeloyl-ACP methyl ester carboxylesterase
MTYTEHFANNNGVRIHCLEFCADDTRLPLVIVPGMINSAEEVADAIGDQLARHTIIMSVRGRGKSDSPDSGWRFEDQASDVAAVIQHFGFSQIALFGHSVGSSFAIGALPVISASVRVFIDGDYAPFYPPFSEQWIARVRENADLQISDVALDGIVREAAHATLVEQLKLVEDRLFAITGDEEESLLEPQHITRLQELFPKIQIERLTGLTHEFMSDDPARSIEAIERCIANVENIS